MIGLRTDAKRSYYFDVHQFHRMMAAGIFEDQKVELLAGRIPVYIIVHLKGPDTSIEVWTGPSGRGKAAHYTDVVRDTLAAGESVPIEFEGAVYGQVAVADLVPRQV